MLVTVGRIGRAHGLRGEVSVDIRTDEPERRFAPGSSLRFELPARSGSGDGAPAGGTLTVRSSRLHGGRLVVALDEVSDRTAAEQLRGAIVRVEVDVDERPADGEEFYDHQLIGLRVQTEDGSAVGSLTEVLHLPGQDTLSISTSTAGEVLVPFVAALVPTVDLAAGYIVVTDRPGLLETDAADSADARAAHRDRT